MNQKIVPHLWYDKQAKEAADFYVSVFGNGSKVLSSSVLNNTPSGDAEIVTFELWGYRFMSISAGPYFKFNPSISIMVNFDPKNDKDAEQNLEKIWQRLSEGGKVLMPLDKYPFSQRYGWVEDKYGFSWQLILTDPNGEERQAIIPSLLYVTKECEAAEKATDFYMSVFKNSKRGVIARYPAGMEPNKEGAVMFTDFMLENQWFVAMDTSSQMHDYSFGEAVSLMVYCDNQEEIDYYWDKLSAVPESEQCGWLKDKYGVSWQIVPTIMDKMMNSDDEQAVQRYTAAFLKMKKFDIAELEKAFRGDKINN